MTQADSVNLDDRDLYARNDPADMAGYIAGLPAQCRKAWATGLAWNVPASFRTPDRVVVLGMGGSAIGAEIVATLAARVTSVPVQIVRGYSGPVIDDHTLVIASSWSGETEETLEAFQQTLGRPGMRMAITSGGRLARLGESLGYEVITYAFDGQPRAAIGWGVFTLLGILERLGVLTLGAEPVDEAIAALEQCTQDWGLDQPTLTNVAKQIARTIHGSVPVILGPDFMEVAARRWAGQMSENGKQWALFAALPETNHNLIVGFGAPHARTALHVLILDSLAVHERTRLRVRLTAEALEETGVAHDELLVGGTHPLDTIMRACYLSDWVSLYLAMLNGADPTEVAVIGRLKAALAQHARS
jgi:glucose/mannose-6-phosphate isomerase